jgi:flavodoxin
MKCALVYYSYSGVTKKVIVDMNKIISGTIIEVTPDKPYNTLTAYSIGCKRALREEADLVSPSSIDLAPYDHVIVAAPVWAWKSAPPINGAIQGMVNGAGKTASVISTAGSSPGTSLEVMRTALEKQGLKVTGELSLLASDLKTNEKVDAFLAAFMKEEA